MRNRGLLLTLLSYAALTHPIKSWFVRRFGLDEMVAPQCQPCRKTHDNAEGVLSTEGEFLPSIETGLVEIAPARVKLRHNITIPLLGIAERLNRQLAALPQHFFRLTNQSSIRWAQPLWLIRCVSGATSAPRGSARIRLSPLRL